MRDSSDRHDRLLSVDLSSGSIRTEPLPRRDVDRFLGGTALCAAILTKRLAPGLDPYSPDNLVVMAPGALTGAPVPGSDRLSLAAKSPQSGLIGESTLSGPSGEALRRAGFSAVVISGKSPKPAWLLIDDERIELRDAGPLWELNISESIEVLRREVPNRGFSFMSIGPAGENLVRFASVADQTGRVAGRTGLGAVLGSKNLKAVAVRGSGRTVADNREGLVSYIRDLAERFKRPEVAVYGWSGSVRSLANLIGKGALPQANFQSTDAGEDYRELGDNLLQRSDKLRHGCVGCPVQCEHRFERPHVQRHGRAVRLEYQTVYALGPLCKIDDLNVIAEAAGLCDDYGMDTVSTGATIAWAMESVQRGVLKLDPKTDPVLEFGDASALLECIKLIAHRQGVGSLLAEGSLKAAQAVGAGSEEWSMQVKGLEMPGYDPRRHQNLGLGLAISARGACHNRAGLGMDTEPAPWDEQEPETVESAVEQTLAREDRQALLDALGVCKFFRAAFDDLESECAEIVKMVHGDGGAYRQIGRIGPRTAAARRVFNVREGLTPNDDALPARLQSPAGSETEELPPEALLGTYYARRDWDDGGRVPASTLRDLKMADFAEPALHPAR
ncbi:MAG: aldehyde ferredoxin oxidoreductase family protein [Chloroflexi bacterium]|nr:aldehyde ferredoxin oxidoreductase family protein [Chloroflexota bacterium]